MPHLYRLLTALAFAMAACGGCAVQAQTPNRGAAATGASTADAARDATAAPKGVDGLDSQPAPVLRVQLHWRHQSQFAGFYVAQARRHFERAGVRVELLEGGPGIDPLARLKSGQADVAVGWLGNALMHSREGPRIRHIAQIFAKPGLGLVCRLSSGVVRPEDLVGQTIGVFELGDQYVMQALLHKYGVDPAQVRLVRQAPDGEDFIQSRLPCATAMSYNELPRILAAGIDEDDLRWVDLNAKGLEHIEDGLYVLHERLQSPQFRQQMAALVGALAKGWEDARAARGLALDWITSRVPGADRNHQGQMLAAVLDLIPTDDLRFGVLDLGRFDRHFTQLRFSTGDASPHASRIWTFRVIEEVKRRHGGGQALSPATRHALDQVIYSPLFIALIFAAILVFGCSGALLGLQRGFGLWGCLVMALITPLGGAALRDFIIGGERLPLAFIVDPTLPMGIALCVILVLFASRWVTPDTLARWVQPAENLTGISSISMVSAYGASIALASNLHWFWAPLLAAISVCGGGILRDVLLGQAAKSLRGAFAFEEVAIVSALILVAGMFIANQFEHQAWIVYVSLLTSIVVGAAVQAWVFMRRRS